MRSRRRNGKLMRSVFGKREDLPKESLWKSSSKQMQILNRKLYIMHVFIN